MSNVNDSENAILQKVNSQKPTGLTQNLVNFTSTVFKSLFSFIIHFICGALILYGCKVAQSNVLFTDTECGPYKDTTPQIDPIETNIFITFTDPPKSMKLHIPNNEENSKSMIIDMMRKYKDSPKSGVTGNFFVAVLEGLFSFNYSGYSIVLRILNYLPEFLIIILGPSVLMFFTTLLLIIDHFYLIYLWLSNLGWFFKINVNAEDNINDTPKWEDNSVLEPFDFAWSCFVVFLFIVLLFLLFFIGVPILALFTVAWTLFSIFGYKGYLNDEDTPVGLATIVKNTFKYHKILFMLGFTYITVTNAFTYLGSTSGVICLITFIIFGYFIMDIFKPIPETHLTPLAPTDSATRSCPIDNGNTIVGGAKLVKRIKKIGRMLQNSNKTK